MRCEDVRDALPALARGNLPELAASAVRAHLDACDACASTWAVVRSLAAARPVAPAGLADRITAELRRREGANPPRPRAHARRAGAALLAVAAVAALLLVAWPEQPGAPARSVALVQEQLVAADPFLDAGLFGAQTPGEAELDEMIRGAGDAETLRDATVADASAAEGDVPQLAMEVGPALGDWPGADGMAAGVMLVDDLSYDDMQLLLEEMTT